MRRLRSGSIATLAALLLALGATWPARADAADDGGVDSGVFTTSPSAQSQPAVVLPGAPQDLLHVHITAGGTLQFFVDRASISLHPGQVVRYTLVAQTPGGPRNVGYEGIDCARRQWTLYAIWNDADQRWTRVNDAGWQRIPQGGAARVHSTLYDDDFCKDGAVNGTAADMAQRIRQGLRAIPY
ncbi:CNP1-like family protein [Thiomonas sp.]|jgi:hypothetical protein|uniref:CNP1-like family protein n=1 Tax=Thiomonas sp. TaxID=2047785 RepID=UPI00263251D5|nr:CNP1-like family protein [Thiomonas sp.]